MYVLNILNMLYTLRFFSSKFSLFHNANLFGSCIIHILYTGCAEVKKNNSGGVVGFRSVKCGFFLEFLVHIFFLEYLNCNSL